MLYLLDVPEEAQRLLLEHVSTYGDQHAFHDDAFANKRVQIGFQPRSGAHKGWAQRLSVTDTSFTLMLQYLSMDWARKLPGTRRKYDKNVLEEAATLSSLFTALLAEALCLQPASQEAVGALQEQFLQGPACACSLSP